MSNTLDSAEALIQLQARVNARIMDLSGLLARRNEIKTTTRMCEVRQYQDKTIFEACVDVETNRDVAISFWFEFGCENKRWHVAASINRTVREGQDVLDECPESSTTDLAQLEVAAAQASDWLVNRGKEFNFDELK